MTDRTLQRNPVEKLAEAFLERYRRGERLALAEYTQQYPELAMPGNFRASGPVHERQAIDGTREFPEAQHRFF
jgi:hypothetical protein